MSKRKSDSRAAGSPSPPETNSTSSLPSEDGVKLPHSSEDEFCTDQLRNRALRGRGI